MKLLLAIKKESKRKKEKLSNIERTIESLTMFQWIQCALKHFHIKYNERKKENIDY